MDSVTVLKRQRAQLANLITILDYALTVLSNGTARKIGAMKLQKTEKQGRRREPSALPLCLLL